MFECDTCNAKIALPGQSSDNAITVCPKCGDDLYRKQPTPMHSEMSVRNMPAPGEDDDGGNPLKEGILADNGWQPAIKRDEYFASVGEMLDMEPYDVWWKEAACKCGDPNCPCGDNCSCEAPDVEVPAEIVEVIPPEKQSAVKQSFWPALIAAGASALPWVARTVGIGSKAAPKALNAATKGAGATRAGTAAAATTASKGRLKKLMPYATGYALGGKAEDLLGGLLGAGEEAYMPAADMTLQQLTHVQAASSPFCPRCGKFPGPGAHGDCPNCGLTVQEKHENQGENDPDSIHMLLQEIENLPEIEHPLGPAYGRVADFEHPSVVPERGIKGNDPEKVDPHEFSGEGNTDGPEFYDPAVEDLGGVDSPALRILEEKGPNLFGKLVDYYESDKSGWEDPDLAELFEAIQQESPGFFDEPESEEESAALEELFANIADHYEQEALAHEAKISYSEQVSPGSTPNRGFVPQAPGYGQGGLPGGQEAVRNCPQCGQPIPANENTCPTCRNGGMAPVAEPPKVAAESINVEPNWEGMRAWVLNIAKSDPELAKKIIAEMGAEAPDELEVDFNAPSGDHPLGPNYGKTAHQGPHSAEQFAMVAEYLEEEGRHDEVVAMLQEPWKYSEEMGLVQSRSRPQPTEDAGLNAQPPQPAMENAPPGATMPMPGMKAPGGPSMRPQGPEMGMMAAIQRYDPDEPEVDELSSKFAKKFYLADHHEEDEFKNPSKSPAAERPTQRRRDKELDTSKAWKDSEGNGLQTGQEYEMHSPQYAIPDIVRIEQIKPDAIEYTITGEYGLEHRTELSKQEATIEKIEFIPSNEPTPEEPESPPMDDFERVAPGETGDLSTPHVKLQHRQSTMTCPRCQEPVVQPAGTTPNGDKYTCGKCGNWWVSSPTGMTSTDPASIGITADSKYRFWDEQGSPKIECGECAHLQNPGTYVCERCGTPISDERLMAHPQKTAGKDYTMMEQREFIDEQGEARNRDKLNLSGTHYEEDELEGDEALFF